MSALNPAIERVDKAVGDRLAPAEQRAADRLAVEPQQQCLAHPAVGQDGQVEIEIDMLEHQARLVDDLKRAAVPLLEGERLVERQPEFAGDHVDRAGQQIGFERGGVLDRAHRDAPERTGRARPMRVRLEHDVRAGRDLADPVGAVIEAGVGRVGGIPGLHPVLRRVGEGGPLDMRRQQRRNR